MGMYDAIKDGISLVQASDNAELLKKFMDIQNGYIEVMKQLEEKNNYIKQLEEQLVYKGKLTLSKNGYYDEEGTEIKYCSRCFQVEHMAVSLNTVDNNCGIREYECPQCKARVFKENYAIKW